jgi:hypothetical protein
MYYRGYRQEMKLEVLWRFQGHHNSNYKFDREKNLMTLDVLQSFHNKPLNKKLEKRLINIQAKDTNLMKHF